MNKLKLIFIIFGCLSAGIIIGNAITGITDDNTIIVEKQKQLIDLQTTAIDSLGNHLVFTHDCDLPLCDNAILDSINIIELQLDSLYEKEKE